MADSEGGVRPPTPPVLVNAADARDALAFHIAQCLAQQHPDVVRGHTPEQLSELVKRVVDESRQTSSWKRAWRAGKVACTVGRVAWGAVSAWQNPWLAVLILRLLAGLKGWA